MEMLAIVIGDQEALVAEIRSVVTTAQRGYQRIDAVSSASATAAVQTADYALAIVVLPLDREMAAALLGAIGLAQDAQDEFRVVGRPHGKNSCGRRKANCAQQGGSH